MLIKEMQEYSDGVNVDRLVSFAALVSFMKIQESNRGYLKRYVADESSKNLQKSENLFKLNKSPFRNVGRGPSFNASSFKRSPFKNIK
jgi:hypothetical protein